MALSDTVDFNVYLNDTDITNKVAWPPVRFRARDNRLNELNALYRGDFSKWLKNETVIIAYLHSYSTKVAQMLLMSEPRVRRGEILSEDDDDVTQSLHTAMFNSLIDMSVYGVAVVTSNGEEILSRDVLNYYPKVNNGHVFTKPVISDEAKDSYPDRIEVTTIEESNLTTIDTFHYSPGRIGQLIDSVIGEPLEVAVIPRPPYTGIWGESKYTELASVVIEISKRFSSISKIQDVYGRPIPVFTRSRVDAEEEFPTGEDEPTEDDIIKAINDGQLKEISSDTLSIDDANVDVSFLQPQVDGNHVAIMEITQLTNVISALTGIPSLADVNRTYNSGESLKLQYLPFYAETREIQNIVRLSFQELIGETIEWRHIFDIFDDERNERIMPNVITR